jgi:hypothetical protein
MAEPEGADEAQDTGFYEPLLSADVRRGLARLPRGPSALAAEMGVVRALLRAVALDESLAPAARLAAFARGVDALGRLYRVWESLEAQRRARGQSTFDELLAHLEPGDGEAGHE